MKIWKSIWEKQLPHNIETNEKNQSQKMVHKLTYKSLFGDQHVSSYFHRMLQLIPGEMQITQSQKPISTISFSSSKSDTIHSIT